MNCLFEFSGCSSLFNIHVIVNWFLCMHIKVKAFFAVHKLIIINLWHSGFMCSYSWYLIPRKLNTLSPSPKGKFIILLWLILQIGKKEFFFLGHTMLLFCVTFGSRIVFLILDLTCHVFMTDVLNPAYGPVRVNQF